MRYITAPLIRMRRSSLVSTRRTSASLASLTRATAAVAWSAAAQMESLSEARAPDAAWLLPAVVTDPSDPKLAHLDGLNLSRAWMLEGIAAALSPGGRSLASVRAAAARHRERGLAAGHGGWWAAPTPRARRGGECRDAATPGFGRTMV